MIAARWRLPKYRDFGKMAAAENAWYDAISADRCRNHVISAITHSRRNSRTWHKCRSPQSRIINRGRHQYSEQQPHMCLLFCLTFCWIYLVSCYVKFTVYGYIPKDLVTNYPFICMFKLYIFVFLCLRLGIVHRLDWWRIINALLLLLLLLLIRTHKTYQQYDTCTRHISNDTCT